MSDAIYLTEIEITDLGGIKYWIAKLGRINVVTGENGAGKSTVIDSIKTVFEGGSAPQMVRVGCEEGWVKLTFSNGYTALKTIKTDGYDLKVRTPEGGDAKRPAELLKEWAPSLSFDPLAFLAADPKEKTAFLLRTLPLTFTADEVNEAVGAPVATRDVSLTQLNEIIEGRRQDRTDLNRTVKQLEATINEFRRTLPGDGEEETDWAAEVVRLSKVIQDGEIEKATIKGEIDLECGTLKSTARAEAQSKIAELRRQIQTEESELALELVRLDGIAAKTLADDTAEVQARITEATTELATASANAEQHSRAAGTRDAIEKRKAELKGHVTREMMLSKAIGNAESLKVEKLKKLPIEGLDIKVEKAKPSILIHGIALERLNRQQQIFVAIQAVSKASGKMPLILSEASELDTEHLEALKGAAKDAGQQVVLARWKDKAPLAMEATV